MTEYTRIRNTLISNPKGIMDAVLIFGLESRIQSNVRLYFYKYNLYDLVEIKYEDDVICVYDFKHTEDKAIYVKDNLEFLSGYFSSAGLKGKKFLFDLSLKMPVNYEDFIPMPKLPDIGKREFAFILDKKSGYITDIGAVNIFIATERVPSVDKCVFALLNNSINIKNPKHLELVGCMVSAVIAGLFSGVSVNDIKKDMDQTDSETKFIGSIRGLNFSSEKINKLESTKKVDKFKRIIQKNSPEVLQGEVIDKETVKGEVNLHDIIIVGLDKFMKVIDNSDTIKVCIDCEHQTIRSAYIKNGTIFITPVTLMPLSYFRELLNSDNVEYVLN